MMKRTPVVLMLVLLAVAFSAPAPASETQLSSAAAPNGSPTPAAPLPIEVEVEAVTEVALDYIEGAFTADAGRMARALHPELTKVMLGKIPDTGRSFLQSMGATRLVEVVRAMDPLDENEWGVDVQVLEVGHGMAVVRIASSRFIDHLQMAKVGDEWKIVNVLWIPAPTPEETATTTYHPAASSELAEPLPLPDVGTATHAAVVETAMNYIDGAYEGNASRMAEALHAELTKVRPAVHRTTGQPFLDYAGYSLMVEWTRTGAGAVPEDERDIETIVFDIGDDLAVVKVNSARYIDHLQLARVDGEWKIVNVIWVPNPENHRQADGG